MPGKMGLEALILIRSKLPCVAQTPFSSQQPDALYFMNRSRRVISDSSITCWHTNLDLWASSASFFRRIFKMFLSSWVQARVAEESGKMLEDKNRC